MRQPEPCPEFDCTSCGRTMIVLVGETPNQPRCHRCRMLPGWHKRPEVVALCNLNGQLLAPVAAGAAENGRTLQ